MSRRRPPSVKLYRWKEHSCLEGGGHLGSQSGCHDQQAATHDTEWRRRSAVASDPSRQSREYRTRHERGS